MAEQTFALAGRLVGQGTARGADLFMAWQTDDRRPTLQQAFIRRGVPVVTGQAIPFLGWQMFGCGLLFDHLRVTFLADPGRRISQHGGKLTAMGGVAIQALALAVGGVGLG